MFRPYVAVFVDSFAEAFASRVLWILLVLSTVVLLALAPLGLTEQQATELRPVDIRDWPALLARIKQQSDAEEPSPGRHIWKLADKSFRTSINEALPPDTEPAINRELVTRLVDELNRLMALPEFYDAAAWDGVRLTSETRELAERDAGDLSEGELRSRNRLLLKAAFPTVVSSIPDEELQLTYFHWNVGSALPISRSLAEPTINQLLAGVMDFFVGTLGVFIAILVTASMIPQTFEAGAIDLLLSKPVNRSLLFLMKFCGGCAFILLNAGYFIIGLWLVIGLRFGIWNNSLPLCIPLFLFLFMIYYSVSAMAGVLWKNATVAIVITILFWVCCFSVGTTKGLIEELLLNPARLVTIVPNLDPPTGVSESGRIVEWREDNWAELVPREPGDGPPAFVGNGMIIGPVYDEEREELAYLHRPFRPRRMNFMGPAASFVTVSRAEGAWKRRTGPTPPTGASWIFLDGKDRLLVVTPTGVFRYDRSGGAAAGLIGIALGLSSQSPFVPLGPETPLLLPPDFAASLGSDDRLVIFGNGRLLVLAPNADGRYAISAERTLEDVEGPATPAFIGDRVAVAEAEGKISLFAARDLRLLETLTAGTDSEPYSTSASPDGTRLAVLYHDGTLVLCDARGTHLETVDSDASAVSFDATGRLLVVDRRTRLTTYDVPEMLVVDRISPPRDTFRLVYDFLILPIYTVLPKPGELSDVVSYVLTDDDSIVMGPQQTEDVRQARRVIDVYRPIFSSLAFVIVVLAFTCIYIERIDI